MEDSSFGAIALYERERSLRLGAPLAFHTLIVDADGPSLGLCACDERGRVRLLGTRPSGTSPRGDTGVPRELEGMAAGAEPARGDLAELNARMRRYYRSGRSMNRGLRDVLGTDLDCEGCDRALAPLGDALDSLLAGVDGWWRQEGVEPGACRIILAGRAAAFYPVAHRARRALTFDPFLPDPRFVGDAYEDGPGEIESAAREANERRRRLRLSLTVLDRGGASEKVRLPVAESGAPGQAPFKSPILIVGDDRLQLETDGGKAVTVALPYDLGSGDYDVIDVAVLADDARPVLRIRRAGHPARPYDVPLP